MNTKSAVVLGVCLIMAVFVYRLPEMWAVHEGKHEGELGTVQAKDGAVYIAGDGPWAEYHGPFTLTEQGAYAVIATPRQDHDPIGLASGSQVVHRAQTYIVPMAKVRYIVRDDEPDEK